VIFQQIMVEQADGGNFIGAGVNYLGYSQTLRLIVTSEIDRPVVDRFKAIIFEHNKQPLTEAAAPS
jgi:hypothetical protein